MAETEKWFKEKLEEFKDDADFYAEQLILDLTERIVAVMKEMHLNRSDLAKRLGVSKAFVTKLLNGNPNMTLKTMASLAKSLGCLINIDLCPEGTEMRKVYKSSKRVFEDNDFTDNVPVKLEIIGDDSYERVA
jgi:transcriptional regulator with XRE-family HTH domain